LFSQKEAKQKSQADKVAKREEKARRKELAGSVMMVRFGNDAEPPHNCAFVVQRKARRILRSSWLASLQRKLRKL
jgi:hypothetical protein